MVVVSASRLHVRKPHYGLLFLIKSFHIARELRTAPGFIEGRLLREGRGRYWTCTLWEDHATMDAFRNAGHHLDAMRRHLDWMDELVHGNWEQAEAVIPEWRDLHERLARNAHFTRLPQPSVFQSAAAVPGFDEGSRFHGPRIRPPRGARPTE